MKIKNKLIFKKLILQIKTVYKKIFISNLANSKMKKLIN